MKCSECGGEIAKLSMENSDGVKGCLYHCNACHRNFWKAPDETIVDSTKVLSIDINEKFRREIEKYKKGGQINERKSSIKFYIRSSRRCCRYVFWNETGL